MTAATDAEFQRLMAALGEAKSRYDDVVRDVSVVHQSNGEFALPDGLYQAWREASARLREADDAVLAFLQRSPIKE